MKNRILGVLLDVDGTLVDSNGLHALAWREALSEHGHHVALDVIRKLIGMGGDHLLPMVTDISSSSDEGQAILGTRSRIFKDKYVGQVQAFPDARTLLETLTKRGLRLVIATSATSEELSLILAASGLDACLNDKVTASDADHSKPSPDIITAALEKIDLAPQETVMLGDTAFDIDAAKKAGVLTIALRCGGRSDEELHGAAAIYDDPSDLLRRLDNSLLASPLAAKS